VLFVSTCASVSTENNPGVTEPINPLVHGVLPIICECIATCRISNLYVKWSDAAEPLRAYANTLVNITVATLMLIRLVRARREFNRALPNGCSDTNYGGLISIIIESSAPLALFGACYSTASTLQSAAIHGQSEFWKDDLVRFEWMSMVSFALYVSFSVSKTPNPRCLAVTTH